MEQLLGNCQFTIKQVSTILALAPIDLQVTLDMLIRSSLHLGHSRVIENIIDQCISNIQVDKHCRMLKGLDQKHQLKQ